MAERKTIHKWFWVWEFEKEEAWLNGMAENGWILDSVGFAKYCFVKGNPGEYTIRVEAHARDEEYIGFMEETGAEYLGRVALWIFFRKKVTDGKFDLFSDIDSRISHLEHIGKALIILGGANIVMGMSNILNPVIHIGWINLLAATFVMYALGRIHGKKEALERERMLHE